MFHVNTYAGDKEVAPILHTVIASIYVPRQRYPLSGTETVSVSGWRKCDRVLAVCLLVYQFS